MSTPALTRDPSAPNPRLRAMLEAPIAGTVLRLAWPNVVMMAMQASTGLIEAYWLAKLGTEVLAGISVVVPVLVLMQNMSSGAMGGGISSAIARLLGAGKRDDADRTVLNAVAINAVLGLACTVVMLVAGRALYRACGATDGVPLDSALTYSNLIFAGIALLWIMNALASVVRGTGNMLVPGAVIAGGALILVPLSPCLIFGWGPFPAMGVAGAATALLLYYGVGTLLLGWYCASGRNAARLVVTPLSWAPMATILRVGAMACLNSVATNVLVAVMTAIVGAYLGTSALAGYAVAARLEYLLLPLAFGLGAPMVAMVGSNIGAGQHERARRIALTGGSMAFVVSEAIGLAAAIWPTAWMHLFGSDETLVEVGAQYLRIAGPFYGFFCMGFSLYFASQGAGKLKWPLIAAWLRVVISCGLGWIALQVTGSMAALFATAAAAMVMYGVLVTWSVASGSWFATRR